MKNNINLIKACFVLVLIGMMTGCGQFSGESSEQSKEILVMGTSADYEPFEFFDLENNEIVGFDVDIAHYIATELGYELEIVDMDFNTLTTALRTGKVDMVLAGMSPTPEREEVVDFTDIYYRATNLLITKTDVEFNGVEDLNGRVLGAQTGTTQEETVFALQEEGIKVELNSMDRLPDLFQQLNAGRIDAIVIEDMATATYLENNSSLTLIDILDNNEEGSAIAVQKGSELKEQINEILKDMKENGELEAISQKWFG